MREALIWGASGGIGSAMLTLLQQRGWRVHCVSRSQEGDQDACSSAYFFDASDESSIRQACFQVAQESAGIDLMLFAVGDIVYARLDEMSASDWNATLVSNLTGAFWAAVHALPLMKDNGHMVFIGAYLDHLRLPRMGAYAAAKAGLQELVAVLAKENRKLSFTLLRPGPVRTPFWDKVGFRLPADAKDPEKVAEALLAHVESGASGFLDL